MASKRVQIADDYHNSRLSVRQIAAKHGVCIRTVYYAIGGNADRKGWKRQHRRYLALTKDEAQALYKEIKSQNPVMDCIAGRIRTIIKDMTY